MSGSLTRYLTGGQVDAILNKVVGEGTNEEKREILEALLQDKLEVSLAERALKWVDRNGRIIPRNLNNAVCDENKDFHLIQPPLETMNDYASRLLNFHRAFKPGPIISLSEFKERSEKLIKEIKGNKGLANLLNRIHLPVIMPWLEEFSDYGKTLEGVFSPAIKSSYEKRFPDKKFYNDRECNLVRRVSIAPGSRHDLLVDAMKKGIVVAIYFPVPFQGFSTLASRDAMAVLPKSLILSGGFDTFSAISMYPDVLARDLYIPGYNLSALVWQSTDYSLYLMVRDDGSLYFNRDLHPSHASGKYSSGLLVLGSV